MTSLQKRNAGKTASIAVVLLFFTLIFMVSFMEIGFRTMSRGRVIGMMEAEYENIIYIGEAPGVLTFWIYAYGLEYFSEDRPYRFYTFVAGIATPLFAHRMSAYGLDRSSLSVFHSQRAGRWWFRVNFHDDNTITIRTEGRIWPNVGTILVGVALVLSWAGFAVIRLVPYKET